MRCGAVELREQRDGRYARKLADHRGNAGTGARITASDRNQDCADAVHSNVVYELRHRIPMNGEIGPFAGGIHADTLGWSQHRGDRQQWFDFGVAHVVLGELAQVPPCYRAGTKLRRRVIYRSAELAQKTAGNIETIRFHSFRVPTGWSRSVVIVLPIEESPGSTGHAAR